MNRELVLKAYGAQNEQPKSTLIDAVNTLDISDNERLAAAISRLSYDEQVILSLTHEHGLKIGEIAEVMDMDSVSVQGMYRTSIQKLHFSMKNS